MTMPQDTDNLEMAATATVTAAAAAAGDHSPVLRCGLCNKPFAKQSTLKRHGYYCRSRPGGSAPRARSCVFCVKTKARCDGERPSCSRCISRGKNCEYPANAARATTTTTQSGTQRTTNGLSTKQTTTTTATASAADPPPSMPSFITIDNDNSSLNDALLYNTLFPVEYGIQQVDVGDDGQDDDSWDGPGWSNFVQSQMQQAASLTPNTLINSEPSLSDEPFTTMLQQAMSSPKSQIPRMPTYTMRSLFHRPQTDSGNQRISQLMLQTLKSYPLMMLRQKTPPPFIHPRLMLSDAGNNDAEPWHNCVSLMHMLDGGIQGSRKLFWRNVRTECERFCQEYLTMSKWELLAGMQALAIYVIMRLDEGAKDYNNFDMLLLKSVTVIATSLMSVDTTSCPSSPSDKSALDVVWKNWILEESRRRLCVLFQIINMLIDFEPAAMCDSDGEIVLAPLPAQKLLWEASDEVSWKLTGQTDSEALTEFGLARNGYLVKLEKPDNDNFYGMLTGSDGLPLSRRTAKWDDWCSGMDGIGGLVMLAASLLQ